MKEIMALDEWIMERYSLAAERVRGIAGEKETEEPFLDFFGKMAQFLQKTTEIMEQDCRQMSEEELARQNHALYEDILPENYGTSYGNPAYAEKMLGE